VQVELLPRGETAQLFFWLKSSRFQHSVFRENIVCSSGNNCYLVLQRQEETAGPGGGGNQVRSEAKEPLCQFAWEGMVFALSVEEEKTGSRVASLNQAIDFPASSGNWFP